MIQDHTIVFGHGSLLICSSKLDRVITIKHIKPPLEIGASVTADDNVTVLEEIAFAYQTDMKELLEQLPHLADYGYKLPFRSYLFDFTHFNEKSVDVLRRAIKHVMDIDTRLLAC